MLFDLNMDYKRRNQIIFGRDEAKDFESFRGMTLDTLKLLFAENFIDPEDSQNCAPEAAMMLEFMEAHPGVTAHGYAVSHKRDDYRVTIEGLEYDGEADTALVREFAWFANGADELTLTDRRLYFWFD
jgi:hypothetical protein